jgi:hypothetical protein
LGEDERLQAFGAAVVPQEALLELRVVARKDNMNMEHGVS